MKNKALALAITLSLAMSTTGFASEDYAGQKLSSNKEADFGTKTTNSETYPTDTTTVKATTQVNNGTTTKSKEGIPAAAKTALPITLYGDHVVYHQDTGDFTANGNVRIYQGKQRIYTTLVAGNMKSGDVYLKNGGKLLEGDTSTTGENVHYNFNTKSGTLEKISGNSGPDFYRAEEGAIYPDRIELGKGATTTRCPAIKHTPCLEIRASKVVIYPGEKLIAYDVKVYVKGKHIYTRDRLISDISGGENKAAVVIPHIGYSSDHGMEFIYNYEHVLDANNTLNAKMLYYTEIGWRPMYSYTHDAKNFYVKVKNGYAEDSDNNWIKQQSDVLVGYKSHKFTDKLPLSYSMYYEHGLWSSDSKKSWHTSYGMLINHDRIHLSGDKTLFLDLGVGKKWLNESLTDKTTNTMFYKATLGKSFKYGWNTWTSYYRQGDLEDVFDYDTTDMNKEIQWGIKKKFDENNDLAFITRYDLDSNSLYNYTLRYKHNFCCWQLVVEYIDQRYKDDHEINIKYDLMRW